LTGFQYDLMIIQKWLRAYCLLGYGHPVNTCTQQTLGQLHEKWTSLGHSILCRSWRDVCCACMFVCVQVTEEAHEDARPAADDAQGLSTTVSSSLCWRRNSTSASTWR